MTVFDRFLAPRVRQASWDIFPKLHPYGAQSDASSRQLSGYSALLKHAKFPPFAYVFAVGGGELGAVGVGVTATLFRASIRARANPAKAQLGNRAKWSSNAARVLIASALRQ